MPFYALWPYLLAIKLSCMQKNNFGHTIAGADPTQDEEEIDDDEDAAEMENNTDKSASSKKSNEEVTSKSGKISLSIAIRYLL